MCYVVHICNFGMLRVKLILKYIVNDDSLFPECIPYVHVEEKESWFFFPVNILQKENLLERIQCLSACCTHSIECIQHVQYLFFKVLFCYHSTILPETLMYMYDVDANECRIQGRAFFVNSESWCKCLKASEIIWEIWNFAYRRCPWHLIIVWRYNGAEAKWKTKLALQVYCYSEENKARVVDLLFF